MQVNSGKLQILTAAAILVLISGGIAAYAQNQSASSAGVPAGAAPIALASTTNSTSTSTSSTNKTSTVTSTVTATSTITSTTSTTSTTSANYTLCQPTTTGKVGRLVLPITASGSATGSISFSNSRGCVASIISVGGIFNVQIVLRYAKPVTEYNVVLVANGTSYTLGNMVTGPDGTGQMQNQILLKPGTYVVSIQIFDTSSTQGQSTLVLQTGQGTIVSPPFPTASSSQLPNQVGQGQSGQHK